MAASERRGRDRAPGATRPAPALAALALGIACLGWGGTLLAGGGGGLPPPVLRALAARDLPPDSLSVWVAPAGGGAPLVSHLPDVPRSPASTQKLVTTLAGLELLGPAYRWQTDYLVTGRRSGERLRGDLVVRGGGDPWLVAERLWRALARLRSRGLRVVEGDLVLDQSLFAVSPPPPGAFDGRPYRSYNARPSALLVNFGALELEIDTRRGPGRGAPGPLGAGERAEVRLFPPLEGVTVESRIRVVAPRSRCPGHVGDFSLRVEPPGGGRQGQEPRYRLVAGGSVPAGCGPWRVLRAPFAPEVHAGAVVRGLWASLGGEIRGRTRVGGTPPGARLVLRERSPPLAVVVRAINKHSNNVMARNLFLTLGLPAPGAGGPEGRGPATLDSARAVLERWLSRRGLPARAFVLDNGSGLSRSARTTARAMGHLLRAGWHGPWRAELVASLPIVSLDGSMRRRMRGDPAAVRARIKGGLLEGVRAMAGYVGAGRETLAVVALQSHPGISRGAGTRVQDALLGWLLGRGQASLSRSAGAREATGR